jgi:hypothetical protein
MKHPKFLFSAVIILFAGLQAMSQQSTYQKPFKENFRKSSSKYFKAHTEGKGASFIWEFGTKSSIRPGKKILAFRIDPEDRAGAGLGPEIVSKQFTHFGTYAARIKIPDVRKIQPDAGAVVGYFTYHMDSIPGLSEIDFEWLVADPQIIYIGTWTGQPGELKRIGRTLNLAEGTIYNTSYRERLTGVSEPFTGLQNYPDHVPAVKDYDASSRFYTYGFDWYPTRIRWWMVNPSTADTVVLWDYRGKCIPQNKSLYRFNFWHTNNWSVETNPKSTEKPQHPYETEMDWILYKPFKPE